MEGLTPEEEEGLAQVEAVEDQTAAATTDMVGSMVPESPEPFDSAQVTMAGKALESAIAALSGGKKVPLPPVGPFEGGTVLPQGLYVGLRVVSDFLTENQAPPEISFSADEAASSPEGLESATDKLMLIARDTGARESAGPKAATRTPKEPPMPPKPGARAATAKRDAGMAKPSPAPAPPASASKGKPGERAAKARSSYY
jgi:hypothetical protein